MSNTKAKIRLALLPGLGALMVAGALLQAGVANAATYSGKWSITTPVGSTRNTPSYTTNSTHKVSTCVSVTSYAGAGGVWSYELVWYDGGKNKVLYHSGDYQGKTTVCSPVERPGGNDKVYDRIILFNDGAGIEVTDSGKYSFNTY